ncbi:MAG: tRNA pseudouridine(54/55) synthase Pus10, partial [Candidatus Aenigmatarchaeota archaeon]
MESTSVKKKAERILNQGYICNHCLGRQFGQLLTGYTNDERGGILRSFLAFSMDAGEKLNIKDVNFKDFNFRDYDVNPEEEEFCVVCNNFFEGQIEFFVDEAERKLEDLEYDNFLVGTKMMPELIKNEEELWEKVGIEYCEPMKSEINREVGRRLEERLDKEANFKRPDVVVMLDIEKQEVEVDINSICFYAEYDKLKRGIPQSKWPSGKFETSVEEIIAEPFMEATEGSGHKFHASGREDIDALCEGRRPFILQIL